MTATVQLALSLSGKAQEYGAYAGIAAILGLAVLSLLYFAQAREVKRLREWAGRAPERAAELEARVIAEAEERRVGPAPAPAGAPAATDGSGKGDAAPLPAGAERPPATGAPINGGPARTPAPATAAARG